MEAVELVAIVANLQDGLRLHVHRQERARDGRVARSRNPSARRPILIPLLLVVILLFSLLLLLLRVLLLDGQVATRRCGEPVAESTANLRGQLLERHPRAGIDSLTGGCRKRVDHFRDERAQRRAPRAVPGAVRSRSPLAPSQRVRHRSMRANANLGDHAREHPLNLGARGFEHRGVIQHGANLEGRVVVPQGRHGGAHLGEQRG